MNELYPRALKAYRVGPDVEEGAKYYGPYQAGDLYRALDGLLGKPWDDELEYFRHASEDAPVRWLHQVV